MCNYNPVMKDFMESRVSLSIGKRFCFFLKFIYPHPTSVFLFFAFIAMTNVWLSSTYTCLPGIAHIRCGPHTYRQPYLHTIIMCCWLSQTVESAPTTLNICGQLQSLTHDLMLSRQTHFCYQTISMSLELLWLWISPLLNKVSIYKWEVVLFF